MKRWFAKSVMLGFILVLTLALIPTASAQEDELGSVLSGGDWFIPCGDTFWDIIPAGQARVAFVERIPPEFTLVNSFFASSPQYGDYVFDFTYPYVQFSDTEGAWFFLVPADGYAVMTIEVFDSGGLLHSTSTAVADCTTGEVGVGFQGSIYGPKAPKGFELRSLSCSSAVLDAPGGKQVGDNAVYAGQTWYVNPTPKAGADGQNYTEIFVGGRRNGYIPTVCVGGVP